MLAALGEQLPAAPVSRIEPQQLERFLIAALALNGDAAAVGKPVHARQIDVVFAPRSSCSSVSATGPPRTDPREHCGARGWVALPHDARAVGLDLEALDLGHRRLIDARQRDTALVRRPPVAGVAVHFLLRDELGHAKAHQATALARDGAFRAIGEVDDDRFWSRMKLT